jgi:UDP-GlcNAc:undecaprenyl-phosphate GlcNAc-1-phosphate transferase
VPSFLLSLAGFAVALSVTLLATPLVRRLAFARGWVDQPDGSRKLHAAATPSIGGLAIVLGAAAGLALMAFAPSLVGLPAPTIPVAAILGALVMVAVGLYDDVRDLGFKSKLAIEIGVAYFLVVAGYRVDLSALPFIGGDPYTEALYALPLTMLWIVGVINAVNLIDGVDGLASGVVAIAFASLAAAFAAGGHLVLMGVAFVMAGALLGFLRYNFNPATIFMGDSGSLFLGYSLALYSLSGKGHVDPMIALVVPVLALGLPLLDTSLSMVRRAVNQRSICAPDRDHIHHRMTSRMTTRRAVVALYAVASLFGAAAVAVSVSGMEVVVWVIVLVSGATIAFAASLGYLKALRPWHRPQMHPLDAVSAAPSGSLLDAEPFAAVDSPNPSGINGPLPMTSPGAAGDGAASPTPTYTATKRSARDASSPSGFRYAS